MKKIFIGLLLAAAAGTGIYFLFFTKKNNEPVVKDNKELIIGKWKTTSWEPVTDSLQLFYTYDFQNENKLYRHVTDSSKTDTLYYDWSKAGDLVIKKNQADSLPDNYTINRLEADTLQLTKTANGSVVNLQKIK